MQTRIAKLLAFTLVAAVAVTASDAAFARKKPRHKAPATSSITRDYDGTPIIMQGFRRSRTPSIMVDEPGSGRVSDAPSRRAAGVTPYARGSSTYIPPPVPSPYSANSPPAAALVQPPPAVAPPPPITTFSDKVNNAIHDFPLQRGIGNNPNDLQSFIRQRANQP